MANPEVPNTPEAPDENKEMAAHNVTVSHNDITVKNEVEVHDDGMMSHADIVGHDDIIAHDEMVAQDDMMTHGENAAQVDTIAHDEMVAQDNIVAHGEMVAHDERVADIDHGEMVAHDERVADIDHGEMVAHNERVADIDHGEMVAHDERVADIDHGEMMGHDDMMGHDEKVAHIDHGEMMGHDDMMAHGEKMAQVEDLMGHVEMVSNGHMIDGEELMGHGEMVAGGEDMMSHGGEMDHHHHHSHEILFNSSEIVPVEGHMDYIETPPNSSETQPNKRRKKKSIVWEHFTIEAVGDGCRKACCKECKQLFAYSQGSKVSGTSHLKRHIAKGACPTVLHTALQNDANNNHIPYTPVVLQSGAPDAGSQPRAKRRYRTSTAAGLPYFQFDPDRCRHEISRMIIMHEYSLHMVENPGFISFVHHLNPRFDMVSFNTVQGDCVATYLREKQSVQKVIDVMPGRISLTLDVWSSFHQVGYVCITGQYIDSEWRIHRKILNVIMEPCPESETALSHSIAVCQADWGIEGKLFSVTVNQPLTDLAADNVRSLLSVRNPLILNGQLLVGDCLARTLSRIVVDALNYAEESVKKVRDVVKCVTLSESHEEKFNELKRNLQVPFTTKNLALDDQMRWNTTYEMLLAASELKHVFSCLETSDPDYKDGPSAGDWKRVEMLCGRLKILFDAANLLTAAAVPTTNTFFHEAWNIQLELARAAAGEEDEEEEGRFLGGLARLMRDGFDEYWRKCCLVLGLAVVMDPRFKMQLIHFNFEKLYGDASEFGRIINEAAHELFAEYASKEVGPAGGTVKLEEEEEDEGTSGGGRTYSDFDRYVMQTTSQLAKSELEQYLEESLLPRVHGLDVIGWWRVNRKKYPTLSKMARDVLTIPVSTVPPGSVFCTGGKEMDRYRCTLRPETVEALICAKDWLLQSESAAQSAIFQPIKMEVPI
ncbi:unnamed protein product [Cuscuta campestris]|uniref:BED-type domain-containing protein n=1 Tax=Cuscuta campestris TaxID=132261 RepID=A0A484KNT4_9ASTE|nr:unnamed protein product [Cuscuta campestris]